jgi:Dyp-type peroxidase family
MISPAEDQLQPGIFFRPKQKPPPCWRLLLLDVDLRASPADARAALASIARMLAALRTGMIRELDGQPPRDVAATECTFRDLTALFGFGRRFFDNAIHEPPLTQEARPQFLAYLADGDGAFPELPWAMNEGLTGEADVAFQLTGHVEAAVSRAVVEVWKLIEEEGLPLAVTASFAGFGRPDGRGWLEFHDGVSNIESSQRLKALEAAGDPGWMAGGTYMAFLRLRVDLRLWRALDRGDQELIVGRDKLTGAPLIGTCRDESGGAAPVAASPLTADAPDADVADYHDPPQATDPLIEASHTHRANQNRASPHAPAGFRIFRQGYDYLDQIGPDGPELGLNFVSFQADLGALHQLLHLPGWLGDVNFGGPTKPGPGDPPSPALLSLVAGGLYAVPVRAEPFPGAGLFAGI